MLQSHLILNPSFLGNKLLSFHENRSFFFCFENEELMEFKELLTAPAVLLELLGCGNKLCLLLRTVKQSMVRLDLAVPILF